MEASKKSNYACNGLDEAAPGGGLLGAHISEHTAR